MHGSNWRLYVAIGCVALIALTIGVGTWPSVPKLQPYSQENARADHYTPGGQKCDPETLAAGGAGRKATRQREACEKEAEEYRQNTSDLIQQTRAADAAEAQTQIASQGLWTAWFQTIGGFITLAAAIAAAIYARDASNETKRGADAADATLSHARTTSENELRPWIGVELVVDSFELTDAELAISYSVVAKNIGGTVATEFVMAAVMLFATGAECIEKLDAKQAELRDGNKWGGKKTMMPQDRAFYRAVNRTAANHLPWEAGKDTDEVVCMVAVNLAYLTPFHDTPRVSEQSFLIGKKGGGIIKERAIYRNMIDLKACDVAVSSFRSGEVT